MESANAGDCTSETCPVANGFFAAPPSLAGAAFMLAAFAFLIPINLWIGARSKTTLYAITLITGLLMEVMGYVGRLMLRDDLSNKSYFVLFLLGTVMGPTFISAAIYLILPHILTVYGSDLSVVPEPIWLGYIFLGFDVFTLAFQAVGSAFTAEGFNRMEMNQGVNIILVGLALQIVSILGFFAIYFWFMRKIVRNRQFLDPRFSDVYLSARFKTALLCMQLAIGFILIRTIARMVQFITGLDFVLSQSQVFTLVLDGAFVLFAVILLTLFPPGPAFGRAWGPTSPSLKKSRRHLISLPQRSPGSPHIPSNSPSLSPYGYPYTNTGTHKEPRSPAPSLTNDSTVNGGGASNADIVLRNSRRYSPNWPQAQRRQAPKPQIEGMQLPPYERPLKYQRVPYVPPTSLSQVYGQGTIVESEVQVGGNEQASDGSRTGSGGNRTRTRSSPRHVNETMVSHDSIW